MKVVGIRAPLDKTIKDYEAFLVKCEKSHLTWASEKCRTVLDALYAARDNQSKEEKHGNLRSR